MPQISNCPQCRQAVSIPEGASGADSGQCPHCQASFELAAVLELVAETEDSELPPEVILEADVPQGGLVIGAVETDPAGKNSDTKAEINERPSTAVFCDVRCPKCHEHFALETLLVAGTGKALGQRAAAAILERIAVEDAPGDSVSNGMAFGNTVRRDDVSDFRLQFGEQGEQSDLEESGGSFEFSSLPAAEADQPDGARRPAAEQRRRRSERGGVRDMVGAILGGAAGLLIAYYLLNLIGGERFDMLDIYLPGVKHTAVHRPEWLGGPPEEPEGEPFDSGLGDVMGAMAPAPDEEAPSVPLPSDADSPAPALPTPASGDSASSESLAATAENADLLNAPEISAEQLGAALKTVGDIMSAGELTEEGYEAWCHLAEAITLIDRSGGGPQMQNRLEAIRRLARELDIDEMAAIGQWAGNQLDSAKRSCGGILMAGTPRRTNVPCGAGCLSELKIAGSGRLTTLASPARLPVDEGDRLIVLGYIVDQPSESIRGLDVESAPVIWAGIVLQFQPYRP